MSLRRVRKFLQYFEHTYVRVVRDGQAVDPLFPISIWNAHGRHMTGSGRTNGPRGNNDSNGRGGIRYCRAEFNAAEAFHRAFGDNTLQSRRPSIWNFIDALKKQQRLTKQNVNRIMIGDTHRPARNFRTQFSKMIYPPYAPQLY